MRKYLELLLTGFKRSMVFKFELIATLIAPFIFMFVYFSVWSSIYNYNNLTEVGGLTLLQMITYMSISMSISFAIISGTDGYLSYEIREGKFSTNLSKPMGIQRYIFFRDSGEILFKFLSVSLPAIAGAFLIFKVPIPETTVLILFLISITLSYILSFSIAFIVGLFAFWTEFSRGIIRFNEIISVFFSGMFLPIYLFPEPLKSIAFVLPFQAIANTPLSIFIGKTSGIELLFSILNQLIWIVILLAIGKIFLKYSLKAYNAQGG